MENFLYLNSSYILHVSFFCWCVRIPDIWHLRLWKRSQVRPRVPLPPIYSSWFKNTEEVKERNLEEISLLNASGWLSYNLKSLVFVTVGKCFTFLNFISICILLCCWETQLTLTRYWMWVFLCIFNGTCIVEYCLKVEWCTFQVQITIFPQIICTKGSWSMYVIMCLSCWWLAISWVSTSCVNYTCPGVVLPVWAPFQK